MDSSQQEDRLTATCKVDYLDREPLKIKWYKSCLSWGTCIDLIILITTCTAAMLWVDRGLIPHVKLGFYCGDPTIGHRFKGDTVSTGQLTLVALVAPLVIIILVECMRHKDGASWRKIWSWYVGSFICHPTFLTFTTALKLVAGEPRPHFLETCAPDAALNCTIGEYISEYRCLNSLGQHDWAIRDASMSFPSGHAGIATIVSIFCTVYILKRLNSTKVGCLLKPILSSLIMACGFMVSISRVVDRRHHWWDVMAGIVIGLSIVTCCISFHCKLFDVTEKEISRIKNPYSRCICRNNNSLSRASSTKDLLPVNTKNNFYVNV